MTHAFLSILEGLPLVFVVAVFVGCLVGIWRNNEAVARMMAEKRARHDRRAAELRARWKL